MLAVLSTCLVVRGVWKAASVVRACTKVRLSDMVALIRGVLFDNTWVHDENQVAMLVGCRMPGNGVEVGRSAGLACFSQQGRRSGRCRYETEGVLAFKQACHPYALLTEIVALRRLTLHDVTWVHDENQVAMLVGCRLPVNVVEVDRQGRRLGRYLRELEGVLAFELACHPRVCLIGD
ncbi:hypothetical protein, conserved, partial [Eimeria acervulina]